ncbi:hypothetical protein B0H14DRAFT_3458725 [Mycena olivaceomarginata]|nr:hypothetical protein B0H14DRAFT_3458725 [Mycena olivaceomarginata]
MNTMVLAFIEAVDYNCQRITISVDREDNSASFPTSISPPLLAPDVHSAEVHMAALLINQAKLEARNIFERYETLILDVENTVDRDCAAFESTYSGSEVADIIELRARVKNVRTKTAEMSQVRQWIKECPGSPQTQTPPFNPDLGSGLLWTEDL